MKTNEFDKDPEGDLDYTVDWSDWLQDGETIVASAWTLDNTGEYEVAEVVIASSELDATSTKAIVWLTTGSVGDEYKLTNKITTSNTPTRKNASHIIIRVVEMPR
jgi:hypothetical protein